MEEELAQVQMKSLINQICESRGTEHIVDEEFLKPQNEIDQPDLLKCFVSIIEKFSIQRNEMVVFLKESTTVKDSAFDGEKVEMKATNYRYSDSMTAYNVSSDQPCNTTSSTDVASEGIKIISENVTSLENISMVGFILIVFRIVRSFVR